MFAWICPRCGRENRPSDTECPNCKELDAQAQAAQPRFDEQPTVDVPAPPEAWRQQPPVAPPPPPQRPPEPPPVYSQPPYQPPPYQPPPQQQTPPYQPPPQQQQYGYAQEPPRYSPPPPPPPPRDPLRAPLQHPESRRYAEEPARRPGLPTWLLVVVFAFAFLGLGAAVFYGYQRFQKGGGAGFTGGETPANAPKPKGASSLQKYIEVVGIRVTNDAKKRPEARFVVVNHAATEFNDLTANVTLWASTSRSEEDSVGTFTFKLANIGPNEAKEITAPLKTKLKIYEMPDWQNNTAEVQITSP
ncbi:MAG: hypothetical protein JWO80_3453 [Bryobacterales bacterium]|nr:hypothetical protein [Bryobacterales bacterium]